MMIGILIACILSVGLLFGAVSLWQMQQMMRKVLKLEQQQQLTLNPPGQEPMVQALSNQVNQLHQAMGGVVKGLQTMSHQVHNLNQMAGSAMQQARYDSQQYENPQIMLQVQPSDMEGMDYGQQQAVQHYEDLPPEMQQKLQAFQALHYAMVENGEFPSRRRPDLN